MSTCASRKDATMASTAHQPSENTYTGSDPTNQAPKRKRSRDGEQGTRRVAQCTDNNSATLSMKSVLLEDLQSANISRSWLKDWRVLKLLQKNDDEVQHSANQAEFLRLGGRSTVVGIMERHTGSLDILHNCLRVLVRATQKNVQVQSDVAEVSGIQKVVAAMTMYPA
jgi:hypothetical protein